MWIILHILLELKCVVVMVLVKNDSVSWNSCFINFGFFQLCTVYMKQVEGWLIPNFTDGEKDTDKPF